MKAKQRLRAAIEDVEARSGARVDLKQERFFVTNQKIGGGEPPDGKGARNLHDRLSDAPRHRR